jgi:hypothetical protein
LWACAWLALLRSLLRLVLLPGAHGAVGWALWAVAVASERRLDLRPGIWGQVGSRRRLGAHLGRRQPPAARRQEASRMRGERRAPLAFGLDQDR